MDEILTEKFKTVLNGELDRLMNQAKVSRTELASEDTREAESLERATRHASQAMNLRIRSRESRLIKKVRLALERIENGTYGACEECGEPISIKRLEARPVTTKCIECKEHEERLETFAQ